MFEQIYYKSNVFGSYISFHKFSALKRKLYNFLRIKEKFVHIVKEEVAN